MKRFRLTKAAKIMIMVLVVALIGGGVFAGLKTGVVTTSKDKTDSTSKKDSASVVDYDDDGNVITVDETNDEDTINLSIDEWVGYATILQANGGLTTQPGSIFDELGIKVNINIINDATQSSNALIKGDLNAAGYTINRMAFLSNKFKEANVDVVMPFVTNYSNGGDGIIAKSNIETIEDLVDAKIGVPQFSESQAMIVWVVNKSDLSQEDKDKIINNLILFETADEAAKAFFAGEIDVAGTWQPYLSQAESMTDSHILFSTANSTKLIMSGIVFRDDYAKEHPELVSKFIDGVLQAREKYDQDLDVLRKYMPMFSGMSDEDIIAMTKDADLTTWADNVDILNNDGKTVYTNMCDVWTSIGETVDSSLVETVFDTTYIELLRDKYESTKEETKEETVVVTEENQQEVIDTTALLTKSASVTFEVNTAKFSDSAEASKTLDEFIEIAKMLDGAIIEIAGNTDPNPISDPNDEYNIKLSKQRAEAVKNYFIMNGISADRIVTVGNGSSNPVVENDTEEHKAMNRRTDISFKIIEQ
jgi:NitT/TauT family transport system substrate-binding protein